jgi:hypothetical protein
LFPGLRCGGKGLRGSADGERQQDRQHQCFHVRSPVG